MTQKTICFDYDKTVTVVLCIITKQDRDDTIMSILWPLAILVILARAIHDHREKKTQTTHRQVFNKRRKVHLAIENGNTNTLEPICGTKAKEAQLTNDIRLVTCKRCRP